MSGFGTDVVAVACILGGAAVGGVATLAMDGEDQRTVIRHEVACEVETVHATPRVVVATGGEARTIVVAPRVDVKNVKECADKAVRIRVEKAQARMERARERAERAQARAEEARVRAELYRVRVRDVDEAKLDAARRQLEERLAELEGLDLDMEGLDIELEGLDLKLENLGELIEKSVNGGLEREMLRLEKELERLGKETGR